jgi:hypothetical protein
VDTAEKVLIVGGVLNLAYGFVTGFLLAGIRMRGPESPKYLTLAHIGPLMQGPMLLALVFAVQLSTLSGSLETVAASLVVAGSALLAVGDTSNWLQGIKDAPTERPPLGTLLTAGSVVASTAGLAVLIAGVFGGL